MRIALVRACCASLWVCRDISPVAPTHILIIPKERNGLTQLRHATADHAGTLGYMLEVAAKIATQEGLEGFRWELTWDGCKGCTKAAKKYRVGFWDWFWV